MGKLHSTISIAPSLNILSSETPLPSEKCNVSILTILFSSQSGISNVIFLRLHEDSSSSLPCFITFWTLYEIHVFSYLAEMLWSLIWNMIMPQEQRLSGKSVTFPIILSLPPILIYFFSFIYIPAYISLFWYRKEHICHSLQPVSWLCFRCHLLLLLHDHVL